MKVIIQRVTHAAVTVEKRTVAAIENGMLVLVGFAQGDEENQFDRMIKKILNLRIFNDENGKININIQQSGGSILLVSQFTLYADCHKGNRPSFVKAMSPAPAQVLYEQFVEWFIKAYPAVCSGIFGAYMQVELVNDGPVTIILEDAKT